MNRKEVLALADRLIRPVMEPGEIEEIIVREEEDWSGTPSLWVDVFVVPDAGRPGQEAWWRVKRTFSDELVAAEELRFPYIRFRDRKAESEDIPGEAA